MGDPRRPGRTALTRRKAVVPRWVKAPEVVLGVVLLATTVSLVLHARQLWFIEDDWNFLLKRDAHPDSLMRPYNGPHWSVVPLLSYRTLFAIFGLRHYLAFAVLPIALHATVCALLYAVLRRHEVRAWPALVAVLPLALCSAAVLADVLWAFQVGFMSSLAAGLVAVLVHRVWATSWRGLIGGWLAATISIMSSGMAIPMLVFWGLAVLLTQGLRRAVLATAPPVAVYAVWYAVEGTGTGSGDGDPTLVEVVKFVLKGVTSLWQPVLGIPGAGVVFLVLLVVATATARVPRPVRAVAVAGLVSALFTYLLIGVGRADVETPTASRFAYVGLLFTLPALALLIEVVDVAARRVRRYRSVALVVAVLVTFGLAAEGLAREATYVHERRAVSPGLRERVIGAQALLDGHVRLLDKRLHGGRGDNNLINVDRFSDPYVKARLPGGPASPQGRLDASVFLLAAVRLRPFNLPAARLEATDVTGTLTPASGCEGIVAGGDAALVLPATATGAQVALVPTADHVRIHMSGPHGSSVSRRVEVTPGTTYYVASASPRSDLWVLLPPGRASLCAL